MATKPVTVKLSEQRQDGVFKCYKRFIGGRTFYLSGDREESGQMALALLATWKELRRSGNGWSQPVVEAVLRPFRPQTAKPLRGRSVTLYKAIESYLADYKPKVSEGRYLRQATALKAYKHQQPDCPLTAVMWEELNATVAHFVARPHTSHGKAMAVATVQTTVKAIYALYDWLDLSGQWDAPKRLDRLFRVKYESLKTPTEVKQDGCGPETFTVDELRTLWQNATPRQRLYLGLPLNIGETAQGIADLLKVDLVQRNERWVIDRNRRKTGVRGVYPLWPEVATLVRCEMNTDEAEPRLFLSLDGKPLVWFHSTGRVDSVSKTWANLLNRCSAVRKLGHKFLRKTGASMIETLTGSDRIAEMYLSHKGDTVAKKHYLARDFSTLANALDKMRAHLDPVFSVAVNSIPDGCATPASEGKV